MVLALMALLLLVMAAPARAASPGDLDATFGGDGLLALPAAGAFVPRAVGVDGKDRIVVGGYLCTPEPPSRDGTCLTSGDASFRLARLTPDGGLDPEFGENGFVTTQIGEGRSQALDLIVWPDGRVLAAGVARVGGRDVFALARFTAGGALDPSFGDGGVALAAVGASYASLGDVAPGPSGTIVAAGQAVDDALAARMAVARFEADGDLDPTFGDGGVTLGGSSVFGYGLGVTTRPGGATLVAGLFGASADPDGYRFAELRATSRGYLDPGFDADGVAEQQVGSASSFANAVASAPGGWVAAGAAVTDGYQAMAAVRGSDDGTLIGGFGRDGSTVIRLLQGSIANDVLMEGDRPVLVGQAATSVGGYAFATVRLTESGRRDPEFSGDGVAIVRWPDYPIARATAGALQRGGRLVTVGIGCVGGTDARCTEGTSRLLIARQLVGTDRTAPAIRVGRLDRRISVRRLRRLPVRVGLSEPGRLSAQLWSGRRLLWATRRREPDDRFTVRVAARRAVLAHLRGRRLQLALRATDLSGNTATRRVTFRLRRR